MAKYFTEDDIRQLEENQYVLSVNERFIFFTAEFKRLYNQYLVTKKPKRILTAMGVDAELLGYARIHSITMHISNEFKSRGFFSDESIRRSGEICPETACAFKIQYLEKELARTKQENEFLKKISLASKKEKST